MGPMYTFLVGFPVAKISELIAASKPARELLGVHVNRLHVPSTSPFINKTLPTMITDKGLFPFLCVNPDPVILELGFVIKYFGTRVAKIVTMIFPGVYSDNRAKFFI